MGNKIAVVIPWFDSGSQERSRALQFVKQNVESWGIAEIFMGDSPSLNRAGMRNNGALKAIEAGYTKLFFNDADSLITRDQALKMMDMMDRDGVVYPYNRFPVHLTQDQSQSVYDGQWFYDFNNLTTREIVPGAGNFGCNSHTFELLGGLDEAFVGYGFEDSDFAHASRRFVGPIRPIQGSLVELFHPVTGKRNYEVGPAGIDGTKENLDFKRNETRYRSKLNLDLERYRSISGRSLLDIVVPVVRHGMAAGFMANTVFPVYAVVCDDPVLSDEWSAAGAHIIQSSGHTFAQKCNYAWEQLTGEYTLFIGEDVEFEPQWYSHLNEHLGMSGVVGTNDLLYANEYRSAHLIVSREYASKIGGSWDGPGSIFHQYNHNFTDTETIAKSRGNGEWRYAPNIIIKHNHPDTGRVVVDKVYQQGLNTFTIDQKDYQDRYQRYNG